MRRKAAGIGALILAGGCIWLSGCRQGEAPQAVLAERTESSYEGAGETGNREETKKEIEGGTEKNGQAKEAADGMERLLREKAEAPKRYQTKATADKLELTADAILQLPDASEIPVMTLEKMPYSEEECQKFQETFTELWGMEWGGERIVSNQDHPVKEQGMGVYDTSGTYYLSFWAGEGEGTTSIIWLNKSRAYVSRSEAPFLAGEKEDKEMQILREKSEEFLKKTGMDEMLLSEISWMDITENDRDIPGICFWYRRACSQIPIMGNQESVLGNPPGFGTQYFRFVYTLEGEPVEVMGISRERYVRQESEEDFLLPFAAIAQIFEQHCRVFAENEDNLLLDVRTDKASAAVFLPENAGSFARICVTRVALEYRYQGEAYGVGTLFPVWSFYGSAGIGYKMADGSEMEGGKTPVPEENGKERLLVSIGAGNGVIY